MNIRRYRQRRIRNIAFLSLSGVATAFGLVWLALILATLLYEGFAALDITLVTETTPPPGEAGGLLNAIFGSLMMDTMAAGLARQIGRAHV